MADIAMINAVQDFVAAMADCGIRPVDALDHDLLAGKFVRFKAVGDTRPNSWAVFHQDGRPAGAFGCNKRQIKEKWKADGERRVFTKEERKAYAIEMAARRASVAAEKAALADAVAHRASSLLRRARAADDDHPYLTRKKITGAGLSQVAATRRALLGGAGIIAVMAAVPAVAAAANPASQIEAYRLEYRAVFNALNASPSWDDDCPVVAAQCDRLKRLEALICETPSANRADAEAKLRYACEIAEDCMVLDADDAADLMRDVAKHLITGDR